MHRREVAAGLEHDLSVFRDREGTADLHTAVADGIHAEDTGIVFDLDLHFELHPELFCDLR